MSTPFPSWPGFTNDEGTDSWTTSLLISIILEGIFVALFVVTYCFGSWILLRHAPSRGPRRGNAVLFVAGTVMFLLAVAHFALNLHVMFDICPATVEDKNMPLWYDTIYKAKFILYVTQTIMGDGFMVYRLYIVWDRCWQSLVFPGILLLCDAALGYAVPWTKSIPPPYFFVTSFLTNILCTAFIMSKVLLFSFKAGTTSLLRKVIEGIIQSAAVYSAASIVLVITVFESPHVGYVACLNVFPALIGLVFSSIVIRLGLQAREKSYLPVLQSTPSQLPNVSSSSSVVNRGSGRHPTPIVDSSGDNTFRQHPASS